MTTNPLNDPPFYPMRSIFGLPWSLEPEPGSFDTVAHVCMTLGQRNDIPLATSRLIHYPEYHGDGIRSTQASMQLMVTAPKLLQALYLVLAILNQDVRNGKPQSPVQTHARTIAMSIIKEALYPADELELNCDYDEHEGDECWLGGAPLPYDIAGLAYEGN